MNAAQMEIIGMVFKKNRQANPSAIEVIARGLAIRHRSILICRPIDRTYCYLPGGHVEFGESARVALKREFHEEMGLEISPGPCLLVHENSFVQRGEMRHEINLVFHVELDVKHVPSKENRIEFEWIQIADLNKHNFLPAEIAPVIGKIRPSSRGSVFYSTITQRD
jgi:8-oxo-dGTP diphosphatase